MNHCITLFMASSILADGIKYFKHCIVTFGAIKQEAEERFLCWVHFSFK